MDAKWFKSHQRRAGLTSFDLGEVIGRDRSVISKFLNGHQRMTLAQAQALADALGVPQAEMIEKAGLADAPTARQFAPGFAESDAAAWIPQGAGDRPVPSIAAAMGQRPGIDVWQVRSGAMAIMGYMPGDFMLVDTHIAERTRPGDVVIAQVYDHARGTATTLLRRFEPPVLVAASASPDDRRVHVVDGNNVVIRGKVISSWRS